MPDEPELTEEERLERQHVEEDMAYDRWRDEQMTKEIERKD